MISVTGLIGKLPVVWAAACVLLAFPARAEAQQVTSEQVSGAVRKALAHIRRQRLPAGGWRDYGHRGGTTALCLLAMLNAGADHNDPVVRGGLAVLNEIPDERTYVVSLKCQVYAALVEKNPRYMPMLRTAAQFLVRTQLANGMWSYGRVGRGSFGRGDNSNTQFALLGLHEAAKAGVSVPAAVWRKSRGHFINTQLPDGGWVYILTSRTRRAGQAYGSMTTAGLASLYICGSRLLVGGRKVFRDGAYPDCGKYTRNRAVAKAHEWLAGNFSVRENPGKRTSWLYYYLYGLERVGMISGMRYFGQHDWYRRGAAQLVSTQRGDGSWGGRSALHRTAFAVLFLAKGNRPVLIRKVQWAGAKNANEWNRNIHDLANLTAFIDDKLGERTTWETTTLSAPLTDLRASPILFITGHEFPRFSAAEKDKLRRYVQSGGTLLAEACCGSKDFADGFRALAKELWPEYTLRGLAGDHPVFSSYYHVKDTYGLEGINLGCRTSVFFSPNALSCLWELRDYRDARKNWSRDAFELGTNIAAYATGREQLPNRLDVVELPASARRVDRLKEVPRGAVRIARLIHEGDYNCDPHCMSNLAAILRDEAKVDVVARARHLQPQDDAIYAYPVVFMHGHFSFTYSDEQVRALRKYLTRGGVLVADACCGRKAFDASFRKLVERLFPDNALKPLAKDHPIYTGAVGAPLGELRYRRILADELRRAGAANPSGTSRPPLEAVTIDGRTCILYSRYDFSCALEGDNPYSCRGYTDADGKRLAINIFLYAISY